MKIFLFFFLGYLVSFSQSKYSNDFLSIGIDSRSISMSNTVVSNVSDLTSVFYNPAGLNNVKSFELGVMHSSYFAGIAEYDYAGIAMPVDSNYVLGVAFIRFGIDDILNTTNLLDENGNINYNNISTFSSSDFASIFSLAKKTKYNLDYGLSAKIIHRKIGPFASAWGFGLDIGFQYILQKWKFGICLKDFTSTLNIWDINESQYSDQYLESGNYIPEDGIEVTYPKFSFGVSRNLNFNKDISCLSALELIATWDGQRNTIISSQIINLDPALGLELDYKKIGFLRFGFGNFQKEKLLETLEENITLQPNFGIGINIWSLFIDYSLTDLGNSSSVLYSNIFTIKYKW